MSPGHSGTSWLGVDLLFEASSVRLAANCLRHQSNNMRESINADIDGITLEIDVPNKSAFFRGGVLISKRSNDLPLNISRPPRQTLHLQGSVAPTKSVGIGSEQLEWLKTELAAAEHAGERVVVAAHDPLVHGELHSGREEGVQFNNARALAALLSL
jgi:hypothetical protein